LVKVSITKSTVEVDMVVVVVGLHTARDDINTCTLLDFVPIFLW